MRELEAYSSMLGAYLETKEGSSQIYFLYFYNSQRVDVNWYISLFGRLFINTKYNKHWNRQVRGLGKLDSSQDRWNPLLFSIEEAFFSGVLYSDALLHLSSEGVPETLSDLKLELWWFFLPGMVSQDVLV